MGHEPNLTALFEPGVYVGILNGLGEIWFVNLEIEPFQALDTGNELRFG
jgi:hypothetical protein